MSEIVRVSFHGHHIHTVLVDNEPHVVLRPAIEVMGLSYSRQLKKLQTRSWAVVAQTATTGADGKTYEMVTVDLDTWAMLLANIDENRVADHVRPLVVEYQKHSARALREYWTRDRAVAVLDPTEPVTYTWDEATAVMRQRYGVEYSVVGLTRLLRAAGVLKQNGAPRAAHAHYFWFTGSHWAIHPYAVALLLRKAEDTRRELVEFRFIQARLELEGVGHPEIDREEPRP